MGVAYINERGIDVIRASCRATLQSYTSCFICRVEEEWVRYRGSDGVSVGSVGGGG